MTKLIDGQKAIVKILSFNPFRVEFENGEEPFLEVTVIYPPVSISIPFMQGIPEMGGKKSIGGYNMTFNEPVTAGTVTDLLINSKEKLKEFSAEHARIYREALKIANISLF